MLKGSPASRKEVSSLNPQPLPPSPSWARALPPGPDARIKITEAYATLVARDAYFWAWPLVNMYNRRLAFVGYGAGALLLFLGLPNSPEKRRVLRAAVPLGVLAAVYVALGSGTTSPLFAPARLALSAIVQDDTSADSRDVENDNLIVTFREHPVFGSGFGHEYTEVQKLYDIAEFFPYYRYIPHNSVLGLWAYTGYIGWSAMTLLWVAGIYFAMRAYHFSSAARDRAAALSAFAAILIYYVQCYGDMGLGSWTGVFMISPMLAIAGKLAVASGAWPVLATRKKAVPVSAQAAASAISVSPFHSRIT